MSESLHSLAKAAKNRIRNGFHKDGSFNKELLSETAATVDNSSENLSAVKDDGFYLKVCNILKKNFDVSNPIGELIDKAYYDNLESGERERYILKLSAKYLLCKNRFLKENPSL